MFITVKVGKRGEMVIPAFIRKMLKIAGSEARLELNGELVSFAPKKYDSSFFSNYAKKYGLKKGQKLIYGNALYEEEFK